MRRLFVSLALLGGLLGASLLHARQMTVLADGLTHALREAQSMAEEGAWDRAGQLTDRALEGWEDHHGYVYLLLRHTEADQILVCFRSVIRYLELEEMDQYAAANSQLITQLELLAEMEQPSWLNVL